MSCRAKHAPLENLRPCDRSMCLRHMQKGTLQVICTWIFSRVDVCVQVLFEIA